MWMENGQVYRYRFDLEAFLDMDKGYALPHVLLEGVLHGDLPERYHQVLVF